MAADLLRREHTSPFVVDGGLCVKSAGEALVVERIVDSLGFGGGVWEATLLPESMTMHVWLTMSAAPITATSK